MKISKTNLFLFIVAVLCACNMNVYANSISGSVLNDFNGKSNALIDGNGVSQINGEQLHINLVDQTGLVVAAIPVGADGNFIIENVVPNVYKIQLSRLPGWAGNVPPPVELPYMWANTAENNGSPSGSDGNPDGIMDIYVAENADVTNLFFGIEHKTEAYDVFAPPTISRCGGQMVQIDPLQYYDFEESVINTVVIETVPYLDGQLYYDEVLLVERTVIENFNPELLLIDPFDGDLTIEFKYSIMDAAGLTGTVGTIHMPFETRKITGNVYHDPLGLTDGNINGEARNLVAGNQLYIVLNDQYNEAYAFTEVQPNGSWVISGLCHQTYSVHLSINPAIVGVQAINPILAGSWVYVGESALQGPDGEPNGILDLGEVLYDIYDIKYGIEQRPKATSIDSEPVSIPSGDTHISIPELEVQDPEDADAPSIRIERLPDETTQGYLYYDNNLAYVGQVIDNYDPILLTADPHSTAEKIVFKYVAIDNANQPSNAAVVTIPLKNTFITGNIFNDANGMVNGYVDGTAISTVSEDQLYVTLNSSNYTVIESTPVESDGSYTINGLVSGNYYIIQVGIIQGTIGNQAPSTFLPEGWVNTGEKIGTSAGHDGNISGKIGFNFGNENITNANFGIEKRPETTIPVSEPLTDPGGFALVKVPDLGMIDHEDGVPSTIVVDHVPSIYRGVLYYNNSIVYDNTAIYDFDPALFKVDPTSDQEIVFHYRAIDAANQSSAQREFTMPISVYSLSGNVFHDSNGMKDDYINGPEISEIDGDQLYITLSRENSTVIQSIPVNSDGSFVLENVVPDRYFVSLGTTPGNVGFDFEEPALTNNWEYMGEKLGTGSGNDGLTRGVIVATVESNLSNFRFGIQKRPDAEDVFADSQPNPGSYNRVDVPNLIMSDFEDIDINTIYINSLPNNARLYYNNYEITSVGYISNFDQSLFKVDPNDGLLEVQFNYQAVDLSGYGSRQAIVSMSFGGVTVQGKIYNDSDGMSDTKVDGVGIGLIDDTEQIYISLLDHNGAQVASSYAGGDGQYIIEGVIPGDYKLILGMNPYENSLPAKWSNTGEFTGFGSGDDGIPDGIQLVTVSPNGLIRANFGINKAPEVRPINQNVLVAETNDDGTVTVLVPELLSYDYEDGFAEKIVIKEIPDAELATLVYDEMPLQANDVIEFYNHNFLKLEMATTENTNVSFRYAAIDQAGLEGQAETVELYVSQNSVTLPIELFEFDAYPDAHNINLTWTTVDDDDDSKRLFEVERSNDGITFETIQVTPGKAGNQTETDYFHTDENPYFGLNYYRIKQIEADGTYNISHIIGVNFIGLERIVVNLYPVPAASNLNLRLIQKSQFGFEMEDYQVMLMDEMGRILESLPFEEKMSIDLTNYMEGMYFISIINSKGRVVYQSNFLKQL